MQLEEKLKFSEEDIEYIQAIRRYIEMAYAGDVPDLPVSVYLSMKMDGYTMEKKT